MTRFSGQLKNYLPLLRRDLEPVPLLDTDGRTVVRLDDPLKLSKETMLLPAKIFFLLHFFDGKHTFDDVCARFSQQFREDLPPAVLQKLVKSFDHAYLLDNERFARKWKAALTRYRRMPVRPAAFSECYGAEPDAVRTEIDGYLAAASFSTGSFSDKAIIALIAPHIDPRLGGPTYAAVYQAAAAAPADSVYIIFGISHHAMANAFALTDKPFALPGGIMQTDTALCQRVASRCRTDYFQDELHHKYEHSIEFQTIFLSRFARRPFRILPVLCGFSHAMKEHELRQFDEFTDAVQRAIEEERRHVVLVAAVDLSHVGPRYGDAAAPDPFRLAEIEGFDQKVLDAVMRRDLETFDRLFLTDDNRYNICGYPALRTLIKLLPPSQSVLVSYENAVMDAMRSRVTFAGVVFHRP